jgi:hypothetical protein
LLHLLIVTHIKQRVIQWLKLAIVLIALYYVSTRIAQHAALFKDVVLSPDVYTLPLLVVVLLLPVNIAMETFRWKTLVRHVQHINFLTALKGVLSGFTTALASPNRMGEFVGRVLFLPEQYRVAAGIVSGIGGILQVLVTTLVALPILIFHDDIFQLVTSTDHLFPLLAVVVIIPFSILFIFPKSWLNAIKSATQIPGKRLSWAASFTFIRFTIYSIQLAILLSAFSSCGLAEALQCAVLVYFFVTVIPTFAWTEIVVRGTVSGIVAGALGISEEAAIISASLLWIVNVVVPAGFGAILLLVNRENGE